MARFSVEPMAAASELSLQEEQLRLPKQSMMNSRLPKQMVSSREKPPRDRHSSSVATVNAVEGTIGTSKGKAHCKPPYIAHQLSVFSTPTRAGWTISRILVLRWSCEL
jgi:hypothetical protein